MREDEGITNEEIEFQRAIDRAAQHVEEMERREDEVVVPAPAQTMSDAEFEAAVQNSAAEPLPPGAIPADHPPQQWAPQPATASTDVNSFQEMFENAEVQQSTRRDTTPKPKAKAKAKPVTKLVNKGKEFLDVITPILNRYCGEENWSIDRQDHYVTNNTPVLQVRWPIIHMTNRGSGRHTIKDVVVGLPTRNSATHGEFCDSIYGGRQTLSNVEASCGYRHSHIYGNSNGLQPFCTGSDSINDLWTALKMDGYMTSDFEIRFEGFLHQLEAFLSYESIEGVPYFRISQIAYRRSSGINSGTQLREIQKIAAAGIIERIELSLDFNNATLEIVETDDLHSMMAAEVENHQRRMDNGDFVAFNDETIGSRPGYEIEMDPVVWKGDRIKTYVEPIHREESNNGQERQAKRYVHSQISSGLFNSIKQQGEEYLRGECQKNHSIVEDEEEGTTAYWPRINNPDIILSRIEAVERMVGPVVLEDERGDSGSGEAGVLSA